MKYELLLGTLIGFAAASTGAYLFVAFMTDYDLIRDFQALRSEGILGKIVTLGAVLNVLAFFLLIRLRRESMAKGVLAATIILTLITLFL